MANPSHCLALGLAVGLCGGLSYVPFQVGALLHCTPSKQSTYAYHLWLSPNMCTLLRGYALAELLLPYLDAGL